MYVSPASLKRDSETGETCVVVLITQRLPVIPAFTLGDANVWDGVAESWGNSCLRHSRWQQAVERVVEREAAKFQRCQCFWCDLPCHLRR